MIIQTLVYIYAFILMMNSVFTAFLYFSFKERLLKYLLYFWLSGFLGFITQGVFNNPDIWGFLSFSTNGISLFFLLKIYYSASDKSFPYKKFSSIQLATLVISLTAFLLDYSYSISSSFFCIGIFLSFAISIKENFKKLHGPLHIGFSALILLNAFHFLDYPLIRTNPNLAILGFSLAITFYFIYSIYVPLFIIKKTSDMYSNQLETQVELRTTELKQANALLITKNSDLELLNSQLEQVTKENQMLLSILVHDISNPIQIISAVIDKHIKQIQDLTPQNLFYRAKSALGTILEIITMVRNYHALRVGKLTPNLGSFNLHLVFDEIAILFSDRLLEKEINLRINTQENLDTTVLSDKVWIKNQIFSNLISNAIKFSNIKSTIDINIFSHGKDFIGIDIRDFGLGIPKEKRGILFLSSAATSTLGTKGEKGTGLGLPIVKEYLEKLNGTIETLDLPENEKGTCFRVLLPSRPEGDKTKMVS